MAGRLQVQWGDEPDDTESWMAWRNAGLDQQPEADALGRVLWNDATRNGANLWGGQPSDLTALGFAALRNRVEPESDGRAEEGPSTSQAPNDPGGADDRAEPEAPGYETVTARPGDSISRLIGTSRPAAIGRFVSLNGLKSSTLQAGQNYRVPISYDDATADDSAVGTRLLQSDNARLAALHARAAADPIPSDLFARRFNAGQNVWTGQAPDTPMPPSWPTARREDRNWGGGPAKFVGGTAGYVAGALYGVPRAAGHALGDVKDLGEFGLDAIGAFGAEARRGAYREAADTTHSILQYGRAVKNDPSRIVSDVGDLSKAAIDSVNPLDGSTSDTFGDAFAHEFEKGANLGEGVANIAAAIAVPEIGIGATRAVTFNATRAARVAKFVERGANPRLAEYLAEPYEGMGHHAVVPRRFRIPDSILGIPLDEGLAAKPLPSWLIDSRLNVSKPLGMSRGDFYDYHYRVDPRFHGARLPADLNGGKGWSGKRLGLQRYSRPRQVWAGMPAPLKGGVAAMGIGDGFGIPEMQDQGETQ